MYGTKANQAKHRGSYSVTLQMILEHKCIVSCDIDCAATAHRAKL